MAECSESTGTISAPFSFALAITSGPAQTRVSLFARAMRLPALAAALDSFLAEQGAAEPERSSRSRRRSKPESRPESRETAAPAQESKKEGRHRHRGHRGSGKGNPRGPQGEAPTPAQPVKAAGEAGEKKSTGRRWHHHRGRRKSGGGGSKSAE